MYADTYYVNNGTLFSERSYIWKLKNSWGSVKEAYTQFGFKYGESFVVNEHKRTSAKIEYKQTRMNFDSSNHYILNVISDMTKLGSYFCFELFKTFPSSYFKLGMYPG